MGATAHHCVRLLRRQAFRKRSRNRVPEESLIFHQEKGNLPPSSGDGFPFVHF